MNRLNVASNKQAKVFPKVTLTFTVEPFLREETGEIVVEVLMDDLAEEVAKKMNTKVKDIQDGATNDLLERNPEIILFDPAKAAPTPNTK